jgi:hypothetical protein
MKTLFVIVLLVGVSSLHAQQRTGKQQTALDNFGFEGVTLDTTLHAFKRKFPRIEVTTYNKKLGTSIGTATGEEYGKEFNYIAFEFVNGKILDIILSYSQTNVTALGGEMEMFTRVKEKFGEPDEVSKIDGNTLATWKMSKPGYELQYFAGSLENLGYFLSLKATNLTLDKEIHSKLDAGF